MVSGGAHDQIKEKGTSLGAVACLEVVGIELARRQYCGSPAKDSDSLAAQSVWKQREEGEEREGVL
jgi:hypothetical protein